MKTGTCHMRDPRPHVAHLGWAHLGWAHLGWAPIGRAILGRGALCALLGGVLGFGVLGLGTASARAGSPGGVSAAPVIDGLFGSRARISEVRGDDPTPALDGFTGPEASPEARETDRSVEAFAAKIWYAGAILLTADRMVRSMDSVLESAQIEGRNDQRLGLELSSNGVGMVVRFERTF